MRYVYTAVLEPCESGWFVTFPDLTNCFTDGKDLTEAMDNARDVLNLMLMDMEDEKTAIHPATDIRKIETGGGCIKTLISADTEEYRKNVKNMAIRRTVSIPQWMDEAARGKGISLSRTLQEALNQLL